MRKLNFAVAILAVVIGISSCGRSDGEVKCDLLPVKITSDGKWSMVNSDGDVIYEDEFKESPSAAIEGVFSAREKSGYTLYRIGAKKPEEITNCSGLKYAGCMNDGIMPITRENSRISVIDKTGKDQFELSPVNGHEIVSCNLRFNDGMLLCVTDEGMKGFYSRDGKMAIAPVYDSANPFNEGKAVVGKKDKKDESKITNSIIDKEGKELFRIKEKYELVSDCFAFGWLVAKEDGKVVLLDEKGNATRLPSKVESAFPINKDLLAFLSDGQWGLIKVDGEVVVRAKYDSMTFMDGNKIFAAKSDKKEVEVLNAKGDVKETLDFESVVGINGLGYLAYDGKSYQLLDDNFKPKGKENFKNVDFSVALCAEVKSDYFDYGTLINKVTELLDKAIEEYPLGTPASSVLKDQTPQENQMTIGKSPKELNKEVFGGKIATMLYFTEAPATGDFNPYTYKYSYSWNPSSCVSTIILSYTGEHWISLANHKQMVSHFLNRKYKIVNEGMNQYGQYSALLRKGDFAVIVKTKGKESSVQYISYYDGIENDNRVVGPYKEQTPKNNESAKSDYSVEPAEDTPVEDTIVECGEETVAVEYPEYY